MARRTANDSSAVASMLYAPKTTYTRDFRSENIRRLAEMQETFTATRAVEPESPRFKLKRFTEVPARVTAHMESHGGENVAPSSPESAGKSTVKSFLKRKVSEPTTIPAKFYREEAVPRKAAVPKATETLTIEHTNKDFVHDNVTKPLSKKTTRVVTSKVPVESRHAEFGAVPGYLKDRQAVWAMEEELRRRAEEEKDVPPGMRLMPEVERLETLTLLKAGIEETASALSKFKLNVVVPSQVRRKAELEAKLSQLEEAMGVFGKKKVFVKLDC